MFRYAINDLYKWKESKYRKPLIIKGARQVGKTWLMKYFGKEAYENTVYINFDNNQTIKDLFSHGFDIPNIINGLEIYSNQKIIANTTLLIFDEVQENPNALSSLKYFYEDAPEYNIICAESLLGIMLHEATSFPVGKVDFLNLYPMSFPEFLIANGQERYVDLINESNFEMVTIFKDTYMNYLRLYYYVGGMPEVVLRFIENKDYLEVKENQKRILEAYELDFSKHAPNSIVPRIKMVYESIPSQLAKENKKFVYGLLREGARAKDYEMAIMWLDDCNLIHKIHRINKPNLPITAYKDLKAFKLFISDVGLLSCLSGLNSKSLISGNKLFTEFKGSLTEQYVIQQLVTMKNTNTYYYTNERNNAEIDFVVDNGEQIIPIEVKAETNLMAKSLKAYRDKFSPIISIRISMADYKKDEGLINLPLYALWSLEKDISLSV
ncbi:MAG: ATP-binding protein [Sphaerochaetaceae bacterium]|nr:ATP-binding protein [Sphaerochaetaceae bacterium]